MADEVVDTIAQYDLDEDFPDYANEQNKELNQIVSFCLYTISVVLTVTCVGQRKSEIGCSIGVRNRGTSRQIEDTG